MLDLFTPRAKHWLRRSSIPAGLHRAQFAHPRGVPAPVAWERGVARSARSPYVVRANRLAASAVARLSVSTWLPVAPVLGWAANAARFQFPTPQRSTNVRATAVRGGSRFRGEVICVSWQSRGHHLLARDRCRYCYSDWRYRKARAKETHARFTLPSPILVIPQVQIQSPGAIRSDRDKTQQGSARRHGGGRYPRLQLSG